MDSGYWGCPECREPGKLSWVYCPHCAEDLEELEEQNE